MGNYQERSAEAITTMKDILYKDKEYTIIKKDVEELGHFEPSTWLDIIYIACQPLKEWINFGLRDRKDAEEIIEKITKELKESLK